MRKGDVRATLVINPWDEYAVEEAIRFKENRGASDAIALCLGDASSDEALKTCLAMGCTDAVLVSGWVLLQPDTGRIRGQSVRTAWA